MSTHGPHPWRRAPALAPFCLAAVMVASTILGLRALRDPKLDFGDGLDYLAAAYHLRHHGTFTQAGDDGPSPAAIGREPGYGAVLGLLMALDPSVGAYRPSCTAAEPACAPRRYRAISLLNLAFIEAAGFLVFQVARRLSGSAAGGVAAAAYLLLDVNLMRFPWYDPMSDTLAMLLVSAAMLALSVAWQRRRAGPWAVVGLCLAGATLVKAAFLPFCLGCGAFAALSLLRRRSLRRSVMAFAAAATVYVALTGAWVARNAAIAGAPRLTDNRGGIALSTREVFDHMSAAQYAAAFVFWTPGFGERLAHRLFAPETIARFDLYAPGGFYDAGQNGYGRRVDALMRSDGLDPAAAAGAVDRRILADILAAPVGYALSTLPLLYRGVWIDQFGVLGLGLLGWAAATALRRRDGRLLAIAGFGLYNALFYALISLDIPRYQMTALPAIAVAAGLAAVRLAGWMRERRRVRAPSRSGSARRSPDTCAGGLEPARASPLGPRSTATEPDVP